MELKHAFTVPATITDTWAAFIDIEDVANCFPGAAVTSVEGEQFKGTVKVKLGPIALVYSGTGTFVERDESAHRFVVEAKGKDKRGNGTAAATVTLKMAEAGPDRTAVDVTTDLSITGKPAQFGRGVIQDVSDKLLHQFMSCLEDRVSGGGEAAPESTGEASVVGADAAAAVPADEQIDPSPAPASPAPPPASALPRTGERRPGGARKAEHVDAIDLGTTVLPVLLRTYWRQAALVVLVLLVLRRLTRGRRG